MVLDPGLAQCIERVPMGLGSRPTCGPLPLVFPLFSLTPLSCHFFTESNNKVDKDPKKRQWFLLRVRLWFYKLLTLLWYLN